MNDYNKKHYSWEEDMEKTVANVEASDKDREDAIERLEQDFDNPFFQTVFDSISKQAGLGKDFATELAQSISESISDNVPEFSEKHKEAATSSKMEIPIEGPSKAPRETPAPPAQAPMEAPTPAPAPPAADNNGILTVQDIFRRIDLVLEDSKHLEQALRTIENMPVNASEAGGYGDQGKAHAIEGAIRAREETNRQALDLLEKIYQNQMVSEVTLSHQRSSEAAARKEKLILSILSDEHMEGDEKESLLTIIIDRL